jgi:ribonuclease HI
LQVHDGPKIFCDASVNSQNLVPGNQTGIGVLILTQPARSISHASFLQVVIPQVLEPMEAEAHALLFGAKLAAALDLRNAALLTDNQVVASAVLAGSPRTHPGHWSLRPIIAEVQDIKQAKSYTVIKIDRQKK